MCLRILRGEISGSFKVVLQFNKAMSFEERHVCKEIFLPVYHLREVYGFVSFYSKNKKKRDVMTVLHLTFAIAIVKRS